MPFGALQRPTRIFLRNRPLAALGHARPEPAPSRLQDDTTPGEVGARQGNSPRMRVASATLLTARVMAPVRSVVRCCFAISKTSLNARRIVF